jgi:hypothetical protein
VIGGLIAAGVSQLSTFVVPNTILGIVGLSQVVYSDAIGFDRALSGNYLLLE